MCRESAAEPGYVGPSVEEMERISRDIAAVREQLRGWIWAVAAREARSSSRRDGAAVRRLLRG
jgi:hypothetical protein